MYSVSTEPVCPSCKTPIPTSGRTNFRESSRICARRFWTVGGEVHFETRMDALLIEKDTVVGIETNTGEDLPRAGHFGHGAFGA